jgi:hypothetical protein
LTQPTGSLLKESEPIRTETKEFELSPEIKEWVEKIEDGEEITLPHPIKDDYGQILMEAASPIRPSLVLPLSKPKIKKAIHKKVVDSVRWLAEWCLRLIKMFPSRIIYSEDKLTSNN